MALRTTKVYFSSGFLSFLRWGEIEFTWYVATIWPIVPGWSMTMTMMMMMMMMMSVEQSVE
jgi:hypothetical protein